MTCYGYEGWLLKTEEQGKLLALEMVYLRSARVSRLQKYQNISSNMQTHKSILENLTVSSYFSQPLSPPPFLYFAFINSLNPFLLPHPLFLLFP